jgi:uncharacterized protein YqgQ
MSRIPKSSGYLAYFYRGAQDIEILEFENNSLTSQETKLLTRFVYGKHTR